MPPRSIATSARMLKSRRPSARSRQADGMSRTERMSPPNIGGGSGGSESPDGGGASTGFVTTRAALYCGDSAHSGVFALYSRAVRLRRAALLLVLATALPRLAALLHAGSSIVTANVDKGDTFARTFLADGTYGFIPGHPSAYTQPLYGWFLVPLYWIFGRHWVVVGTAQICVAVATTLIVWQIGRRWLTPAVGLLAGLAVALPPEPVRHRVHLNP